jgi:hypothetical protein
MRGGKASQFRAGRSHPNWRINRRIQNLHQFIDGRGFGLVLAPNRCVGDISA